MARVREVEYDDVDRVGELCRGVGWSAPTVEGWQRIWKNNPALASAVPPPMRGWVLEHDTRIVGFLCNVIQDYYLADRPLKTAIASAMVVAPELRGETMKLVMAFAQQPAVDLLLNTTAAPQTSKIFEFFKFRRMPQPAYDVSLYWVLRPARFASVALRKKGCPPALSRPAGLLLAPALVAEMALRQRRPRATANELATAVTVPSDIGPEFDELWRRRQAEGRRLFADRSSAALRWHYGSGRRSWLVSAHASGRLVGYCAVFRADSAHIGLTRAYLADIFAERDDPGIVRPLLVAAARQARAGGATMLEAVGFPEPIRRVVSEGRPYKLVNPCWPFLYCARDPDVHRALGDPALWHASLYDGDGSI